MATPLTFDLPALRHVGPYVKPADPADRARVAAALRHVGRGTFKPFATSHPEWKLVLADLRSERRDPGLSGSTLPVADLIDAIIDRLGVPQNFAAAAGVASAVEAETREGLRGVSSEQLARDLVPDQDDDDQDAVAAVLADDDDQDDDDQDDDDQDDVLADLRAILAPGALAEADRRLAGLRHEADRLREALAEAQERPAPAPVAAPVQAPVAAAAPVQAPALAIVPTRVGWRTLGDIAGIRGPAQDLTLPAYDDPRAPAVDPGYVWDPAASPAILSALARRDPVTGLARHVWLYGPRGTGKTSFAEQLAAKLGRSFWLVNFDERTEAIDLLGGTGLQNGNTVTSCGVLTQAIQTPGAVILLDEPTLARPAAHAVLHDLLQSGRAVIKERGEAFRCADDVLFLAADNTLGFGDERGGYEGTAPVNLAFADRFARAVELSWLPPAKECAMVVDRAGAPPALAKALVDFASLTRLEAEQNQTLTCGLTPRRLIAWAEALLDGLPCSDAFRVAVLSRVQAEDREALAALHRTHVPQDQIRAILTAGDAPADAPAGDKPRDPANDGARADFS